jgi:hypothetical protein
MRKLTAVAIAIFVFAVLVARADDFWTKKPWKEWSKGDIEKMTHESPWSKQWRLELINSQSHVPSVSRTAGSDLIGGADNAITYYVQFRSSKPVRQAVIRAMQIQQKYDKMSDSDKAAFDNKMQPLMAGNDEVIEVHVMFETNNRNFLQLLIRYWNGLPPGVVPEGVYLVSDVGAPVAPLTYAPPKASSAEFDFTFPRTANGVPVVGPGAKSVRLEFPHPKIGEYPAQTAKVEFMLDKMIWDGKLSF